MSVAQETPVTTTTRPPIPPRRNGRWSGYTHLLKARLLELKREPEVVFWVFVFPLLLAQFLGLLLLPGAFSRQALIAVILLI